MNFRKTACARKFSYKHVHDDILALYKKVIIESNYNKDIYWLFMHCE